MNMKADNYTIKHKYNEHSGLPNTGQYHQTSLYSTTKLPYILAYKSVFWELNFGPKVYVRLIGAISEDRYFSKQLQEVVSSFKETPSIIIL
jgi:hypothetical protein